MSDTNLMAPIEDGMRSIMAKVLVVDDDECIREYLSLVLEENGFEVFTAANVSDALRLISSQTFDVLLSDLNMPGAGDGEMD